MTNFVGGLAGIFPDVVEKFDADQAVDEYANAILSPPKLVRSDDDVAAARQARQQQEQMAQQLSMAEQGANVVDKLGGAAAVQPGEDNEF